MHIFIARHGHSCPIEQARSVSSYVSMCGSSSMTEKRTTTGWSFLGFGNLKTTVPPALSSFRTHLTHISDHEATSTDSALVSFCQVDRTYSSTEKTKDKSEVEHMNVTCAANLLLKSVNRFQVQTHNLLKHASKLFVKLNT